MTEEKKHPQNHSCGKTMYSVEARIAHGEPRQFGNQMFSDKWRRVQFENNTDHGVPSSINDMYGQREFGLYGYQQANALMWWFVSCVDVSHLSFCLETRIVPHAVNYKIEAFSKEDEAEVFTYAELAMPKKKEIK